LLSLALDPGRSGFRPVVIRVRITKSTIARNDQRDALFQRSHAAIVPDVPSDVFYGAPRTLVGSARADVEQNGRCNRHYDEYELHGSSPGHALEPLPSLSRSSIGASWFQNRRGQRLLSYILDKGACVGVGSGTGSWASASGWSITREPLLSGMPQILLK